MIARRNIARLARKALADPRYALRAGWQRLRGALSYRRADGRSAPPETISLFLTFRCNLRCAMCGQWGPTGSARGYTPDTLREQLSRDEIARLIDEVRGFHPNLTLFGGEPMLHPDFAGIVADIKAAGLRCWTKSSSRSTGRATPTTPSGACRAPLTARWPDSKSCARRKPAPAAVAPDLT